MSKSSGTGVKPLDLTEVYGVDAFRYFLIRDLPPGRDVEFRKKAWPGVIRETWPTTWATCSIGWST